MNRRRFLQTSVAATALGLAGCQGDQTSDTDTPEDGDEPTEETDSATPTATDEPTATAEPTETESTATETETATESSLPRLQTDGNWIVTADGEQFTPRGVNVVEPLFADRNADARGGDYMDTLELATDTEQAWYNNIVRVPLTNWGVDQLGFEEYASEYVDPTVEHCREQGVYVIVDYHIIQDWQDESVHADVEEFWDFFAPRYADDPHVLYEFWNEPQNPADNTLENWEAWKDVAQPMVDRIREDAPETPIIVGSPDWTSLTKWAAESPFEGENLIYAGHIYPGDGTSAAELDPEYGAPADEVPVMITEWGFDAVEDTQPGTRSGFGDPFREWLDGRENVGWTAWCLDSHWHPTMLDYDHNTTGGEAYHGHFVKEWLADTRETDVPESLVRDGAEYEGPTDDTPPEPPGNPSVSANDDGTVTLAWDQAVDADTRVLHYNVFVDGELRDQIDTIVPLNEADAEDAFQREDLRFETTLDGFTPGSSYDIHLTAVDSLSNESDASEVVTYEPGGELEIVTEIPQTDTAPTIDGESGDPWADVTGHAFQHEVQGSVESDEDLSGEWRALWDADALYVFVNVTDDERSVDSDANWQDDSIELYVDGDFSHTSEYDGANDFQIVFPRDGDAAPGTIPTDLDPEQAWTETDDGYQLEVALPWADIAPDIDVETGHVIGFDAHVNDDDDGGERDGKLNWYNENDDSWDDPSTFAAVELVE